MAISLRVQVPKTYMCLPRISSHRSILVAQIVYDLGTGALRVRSLGLSLLASCTVRRKAIKLVDNAELRCKFS